MAHRRPRPPTSTATIDTPGESPHAPSEQNPWTKDASSWTPSKTTSLLPTSLPVSKPHRGWDRVPKAPIAQHSRVKQVWRREYGLRSQPNAEGRDGEHQEHTDTQRSSPARIVKKKRTRSPNKKSVEDDDEGEPNHAPTRWERRRSSLRRKVAGQQTDAPGEERLGNGPATSSSLQDPVQGIRITELQEFGPADASRDQEVVPASTTTSQGNAQPEVRLLEPVPAQTLPSPTKSEPTEVLVDQAYLEAAGQQYNESSDSIQSTCQSPSTLPGAESPSPEDYYRHGYDEALQLDQTLDATLEPATQPAIVSIYSDEAAVKEGESDLSPGNEVTYPSLRINDTDCSSRKSTDDSVVHVDIAQKLETVVESSDVSQFVQVESGNRETLGLEFEQAEVISQQKRIQASKTDAFDITEGLELGLYSSTEKKLSQSPAGILKAIPTFGERNVSIQEEDSLPSSPDELTMDFDATETLTTRHLEDDKARLRSFLNRAAANKASKVATTHRRESAQSRRDSDIIKKALASPRAVLEDKDTNLSPTRNLDFLTEPTMTLDRIIAVSPLIGLKRPLEDADLDPIALDNNEDTTELDLQPGSPRRRSKRTHSRIPHPPSTITINTPNKIPVRTDGSERVVLNRSEAQELANLMRKNTRKNKGGAISAPERLVKLRAEAALGLITDGASCTEATHELKDGAKGVRWKEQLVEFSDSVATADLEKAAADTTASVTIGRADTNIPTIKEKKSSTSRLRRLRGLGGTNGTPAKGLLASTLLPDEVEGEAVIKAKEAAPPVAEEVKKERESRLQPPKKLMLNPSVTSLSGLPVLAGKENASQLFSPAKKLVAQTMGKIPVPTSAVMGNGTGAKPVKRLRAPRKL